VVIYIEREPTMPDCSLAVSASTPVQISASWSAKRSRHAVHQSHKTAALGEKWPQGRANPVEPEHGVDDRGQQQIV
jgi:hypothetical protein